MKDKKMSAGIDKILAEHNLGVKLDIGCGANKQPGFVGLDIRPLPGVDIVHDFEVFPWPLPDECATLAMASHVVEHVNPHGGVFIRFMDEMWRVMKPGGQFMIATPYAGSFGYFQDPTHCNPCNEATWAYFDPLAVDERGNLIGLYSIYKPKPWKINFSTWNLNGNMEVVLEKRKEDPSYAQ